MALLSSARVALRPLTLVALLLGASTASGVPVEIGLNFTAAHGAGPPDTMGAVGEEHIVHFLNGQFKVFRKTDGTEVQSQSPSQFWESAGIASSGSFDPRVVYDPFVQRWYAVEADNSFSPDSRFLFAVSNGPDPTEAWRAFAFDGDATDTHWVDFPTLGFDADTVYLAASVPLIEEPPPPARDTRTAVVVIPKADLLQPVPSVANATQFQNLSLGILDADPQLTVNLDGSSGSAPLIGETGVPGVIHIARIAGPPSAPTLEGTGSSGLVLVDFGDGGDPADAPQPGGAPPLTVNNPNFSSNLVLRNGSLWGVRNVNFEGQTTAQWFQIDPETSDVIQFGSIEEPGLNLIYPSIAVNEFDQVVIGFTGVSEDEFASAYAIVGETLNGVTAFGELILLKAGESEYEVVFGDGRNRWGDYSTTVVDPEDPRVFWTFQEWAESNFRWGTQITQLKLVPEPTTALLFAMGLAALAARRRRRSGPLTVSESAGALGVRRH